MGFSLPTVRRKPRPVPCDPEALRVSQRQEPASTSTLTAEFQRAGHSVCLRRPEQAEPGSGQVSCAGSPQGARWLHVGCNTASEDSLFSARWAVPRSGLVPTSVPSKRLPVCLGRELLQRAGDRTSVGPLEGEQSPAGCLGQGDARGPALGHLGPNPRQGGMVLAGAGLQAGSMGLQTSVGRWLAWSCWVMWCWPAWGSRPACHAHGLPGVPGRLSVLGWHWITVLLPHPGAGPGRGCLWGAQATGAMGWQGCRGVRCQAAGIQVPVGFCASKA